MTAILDFLVKLNWNQISVIVLLCAVVTKALEYIYKTVTSVMNHSLKRTAICNNFELAKSGGEIIRYIFRGDELVIDDGKSNLPDLSVSENLSHDGDELEDGKKIIDLASDIFVLKENLKQHKNEK